MNPLHEDNDPLINRIHHADLFDLCKQVPDESVDMILCDLPYGTTACKWDTIIPVEPMWEQFKRIIKLRGAIVLTACQPFTSRLVSSNYEMFQYEWLWQKNIKTNFLNAKIMPMRRHEDILIFGYRKPNYYPQMVVSEGHTRGHGGHRGSDAYRDFGIINYEAQEYYPSTILDIPHDAEASTTYAQNPNKANRHPTQKPLALFEYLIRTYAQEGELVFDPCVGSGVTAVASRNLNRNFICGDITKEYVEMSRTRLQNSNPFKSSIYKNGLKQLSLFE